jgi:hypothetical protein
MNSRSIYPSESGDTPDLLVQKGSNVCCVVTCGGIWFASGKFGVTWKLNQAMVKPPDTFEKGKCYVSMGVEKKPDAYDSDGESEPVRSEPVEPAPPVSMEPTESEPIATVEPTEEAPKEPAKKTTKKTTKKGE